MNSLHHNLAPISNPSRVMKMIDSMDSDLSALLRLAAEAQEHGPRIPQEPSRHLKLHVESESEPQENWSEADPISTRQVGQLVEHLRQRQRELDQREADLQAKVFRWEQQASSQHSQFRKRRSELEQHLSQARAQQLQLIKLQQSLVDSQTALRKVIEQIVDSCEPGQLKHELEKLRYELAECMDAILNRWERLRNGLQ
jgi:malate synthase